MDIQQRIDDLKTQLQTWQTRRQEASEALNQAQAAILQLTGALAFAESLLAPEGEPASNGLGTLPPERCT